MSRPYADHGHQGHLVIDEHVVGPLMAYHDPTRDAGTQGHLVYNVQPISASVEPNTLVAKPTDIAEALTAMGPQRRCDRGDLVVTPMQAIEATESAQGGMGVGEPDGPAYTLTTRHDMGVFVEAPISFDPAQVTHPENRNRCGPGEPSPALTASGRPHVAYASSVRRLTPREYERLQGLPDDFTQIPWHGKSAPDGRRYKAVGNSMAVPVMRWIGERILLVDGILRERSSP
jgi:site-specific DNA-cytosine methylase